MIDLDLLDIHGCEKCNTFWIKDGFKWIGGQSFLKHGKYLDKVIETRPIIEFTKDEHKQMENLFSLYLQEHDKKYLDKRSELFKSILKKHGYPVQNKKYWYVYNGYGTIDKQRRAL